MPFHEADLIVLICLSLSCTSSEVCAALFFLCKWGFFNFSWHLLSGGAVYSPALTDFTIMVKVSTLFPNCRSCRSSAWTGDSFMIQACGVKVVSSQSHLYMKHKYIGVLTGSMGSGTHDDILRFSVHSLLALGVVLGYTSLPGVSIVAEVLYRGLCLHSVMYGVETWRLEYAITAVHNEPKAIPTCLSPTD